MEEDVSADVKSFATGSVAERKPDIASMASYKWYGAAEEAIAPNAGIVARLKPAYNFKAASWRAANGLTPNHKRHIMCFVGRGHEDEGATQHTSPLSDRIDSKVKENEP